MAPNGGVIVLLAGVAIAVPGTSVVAAEADGFCRQLRTIVEDAERGFVASRGAQVAVVPDDGGGDDAIRYMATRRLPGATACGVDSTRADGDPLPPTYLCWFAPEPTGAAAVARIAEQVGGCIGGAVANDRSARRLDADVAAADIRGATFVLSVTAGRDRPVVLAISGR